MSLLTRCPACTTLYKVVPDQLRISQGWVKCGQCGEIFDATQHLMEASTEPEVLVSESSSDSAVVLPSDSLPQGGAEDQDIAQQQHDLSESEQEQEAGLVIDENAEVDRFDEGRLAADDDSAPMPLENVLLAHSSGLSEVQATGLEAEPQPELQPEPQQALESLVHAEPQDTALPLSFMRELGQSAAARHPWARGAWAGLGVALVLGLAGQWVYQDHDRLAASRPQWRPALETICRALQCSLAPLQQIEAIAIDAAAFNQGTSGHYGLSFTLKNVTGLVLAMPSIELTLTDVQDRVVVRRVLSAQELAITTEHLAAHAEWPVRVDVRLQTEFPAPAVVGYRLLAFYP